jgi:pyroglutamyl-peptidase
MARPRVLLTGFGPFPGVADNPSAWLAETLARRAAPDADAELHARILPTAWQDARFMPRLYEEMQPRVMIHFGVSERARTFRIERSAHNRAARRADARGLMPSAPTIHADGADRFDTELPAAALAAHLRACGVPAASSRSAGSYLCNFLYYHSLDWSRRQADPRLALFVHIPPLGDRTESLDREALLRGGHEVLRFVLDFADAKQKSAPARGPALARSETILSAKDA